MDPGWIETMTRQVAHRGPDGEGFFRQGDQLHLGHRRLAIIDPGPQGNQPMASADGSLQLVYNGEIYNYRELRKSLEAKGFCFTTDTDTEVVLYAYSAWGLQAVDHFNGMFAFALWDDPQQRLWLVRDRIGIKPLFYYVGRDFLVFGSEIKALLPFPGVVRGLNHEALQIFLGLNYTPAPKTLFQDVQQLEPSQWLCVDQRGKKTLRTYWDLRFDQELLTDGAQIKATFSDLFEQAVRLRLRSDVPFGAFLSGGLDSSSIVQVMSTALQEPVDVFAASFAPKAFDEADYARTMADAAGAHFHRVDIEPDVIADLPQLVWHGEDPCADSSMLPLFQLAKAARRKVHMVLSGDGADEILAGYPTYSAYQMHRLYNALVPSPLHRWVIGPLSRSLPPSNGKVGFREKLRRFTAAYGLDADTAHTTWREIFSPDQLQALLLSPGVSNQRALYRAYLERSKSSLPLHRMLYADTRFYLPNDMLVKVDRMTMAHGLEARVPFLDHHLLEFLARVPPHYKLRYGLQGKYLLRSCMGPRLPAAITSRAKKGFNIPSNLWFKDQLKAFVRDHLAPSQLKPLGLFHTGAVTSMLDQHFKHEADWSHHIWGLLVFVLWWERFMKAPTGAPA